VSFCLEYWSSFVIQVSQPGVVSWIWRRISRSLKACAPMMLMSAMRVISPSSMSKRSATRLRSSGVTVIFTSTE